MKALAKARPSYVASPTSLASPKRPSTSLHCTPSHNSGRSDGASVCACGALVVQVHAKWWNSPTITERSEAGDGWGVTNVIPLIDALLTVGQRHVILCFWFS